MKEDILIAVPSKNRYDSNGVIKNTHSFIKHSKFQYRIFVEPQEYKNYLQAGFRKDELVELDANDQGLNYAKMFIADYCREHGFRYVFKLDDDLVNVRDPDGRSKGYRGRVNREERCKFHFDPLIENSVFVLNEFPETFGGVSLKYGNELFTYKPGDQFTSFNKRFQSNYIVRTELFHIPGAEKFKGCCYEDFMTFFNVLQNGFKVVQYASTGLDVLPVAKNPGGLQLFDRAKECIQEKIFLERKFPFVIWKQVENKKWKYEPDFRKTLLNYYSLYPHHQP